MTDPKNIVFSRVLKSKSWRLFCTGRSQRKTRTVEPRQINLADLLASGANERQPRMPRYDRGADPQVEPQLPTFCAPAVPVRLECGSRKASGATARTLLSSRAEPIRREQPSRSCVQIATTRVASRMAWSARASRAHFSSMSRRRVLVPICGDHAGLWVSVKLSLSA